MCDDLDLSSYAMYANFKKDMKLKDKADLVEALIGALYVDQDLVCFFFFNKKNFNIELK